MTEHEDGTRRPEESAYRSDWPFAKTAEFLIGYAILAPSGHNSQPWLFSVGDGRIDVIADRRRALPVVDPYDRELVISCGAAIATLELAAARFGFRPEVMLSPDDDAPDLLARIDLPRAAAAPNASGLFDAITERRTTRAAYGDERPPTALIDRCRSHAATHGVEFRTFTAETERRELAELVAEGDRIQFHAPSFRRELASWVHSARSGSRDGMSGTGFGMPDILSPAARFVIRTFDLGEGVAASDEKKILSGTPMLGVLACSGDDQNGCLNSGRALAFILLELTAAGFTASYLNQPIETAELRSRLKKTAGVDGLPQILLRIGRADVKPEPTARRDVSEVIV